MRANYIWSAVGAAAIAISLATVGQAQQAPAGGATPAAGQQPAGGAPAAAPAPERKVTMVGENPEISKVDKEGGTTVSNFNFFRGFWTPAGAGAMCVVTVKGQTNASDNFRVAIYDDQAFYDYMIKEIRSDYADATPLKGTVTQTQTMGAAGLTRKETCKGGNYTIEGIWKDMAQGTWSDRLMFQPPRQVQMSFVMIRAASGEITVNGKSAPGSIFPPAPPQPGGGRGQNNGSAYLTLNETWRK